MMPTFALRFLRPISDPLTEMEILDLLRQRSYFKEEGENNGETRVEYVHPNTGTIFVFTYVSPSSKDKQGSGTPGGFLPTGLTFQMDLPNSSWTAREALQEVSSIARSLRLVIEDVDASRGMHSEDGKVAVPYLMPEADVEGALLLRWKRSCRHVVAFLLMNGMKVPYVPEEVVRRWWEYSSVQHLIKAQVGALAHVLPMFIAEHPDTKKPVTGTVWPYGSAMVIPRCDVLLVVQSPAGILSRLLGRSKASLMPYPEVATRLEPFLQHFEGPPSLRDLRIMTMQQVPGARAAFEALNARRIDPDSLRYLHEEPFTDIAFAE